MALQQSMQQNSKAGATNGSFDNAKLYMWVKALEGKVNNLMREVSVLKNDLLQKNNELKKEVKSFNDDFLELKHQQDKTLQKMDMIIKELKQTAGIEDMQVLKRYIEFWNPLNFVTQRDLERAIEEKFKDKLDYHKHKEQAKENLYPNV